MQLKHESLLKLPTSSRLFCHVLRILFNPGRVPGVMKLLKLGLWVDLLTVSLCQSPWTSRPNKPVARVALTEGDGQKQVTLVFPLFLFWHVTKMYTAWNMLKLNFRSCLTIRYPSWSPVVYVLESKDKTMYLQMHLYANNWVMRSMSLYIAFQEFAPFTGCSMNCLQANLPGGTNFSSNQRVLSLLWYWTSHILINGS